MVLASLATAPSLALGDEADASSLQKEVEQLRQEVQSLKQEVKSLQETPPAGPTPPPAKQREPVAQPEVQPNLNAAPSAAANVKPAAQEIPALREKWRQVDKGMTKTQITEVLGPPTKEMTINGKLVWYYYYPGVGGSSVFFNGDGRVSSRQRPTVGWW